MLIKNTDKKALYNRLLVGTPTLGTVRMEWVLGRYGQLIPCNWSMIQTVQYIHTVAPIGFLVADAQNVFLNQAVAGNFEWMLFIEDDTIPPLDAFVRLNEYMRNGDIPVVSGLYYTKSNPPEPIVYRGRGNSYFGDFTIGDKVWADGIPTGFFLCHMDVMRLMWSESPEYRVGDQVVRRVFEQPERIWLDPEAHAIRGETGTSDLAWCSRVIKEDVLRRAGWPKIGRKKYPFLVDTNIFCRHIMADGTQYPAPGTIPEAQMPRPKTSKSASRNQ